MPIKYKEPIEYKDLRSDLQRLIGHYETKIKELSEQVEPPKLKIKPLPNASLNSPFYFPKKAVAGLAALPGWRVRTRKNQVATWFFSKLAKRVYCNAKLDDLKLLEKQFIEFKDTVKSLLKKRYSSEKLCDEFNEIAKVLDGREDLMTNEQNDQFRKLRYGMESSRGQSFFRNENKTPIQFNNKKLRAANGAQKALTAWYRESHFKIEAIKDSVSSKSLIPRCFKQQAVDELHTHMEQYDGILEKFKKEVKELKSIDTPVEVAFNEKDSFYQAIHYSRP